MTRYRSTFVLLTLFAAGLGLLWWAERAGVHTREQRQALEGLVLPALDVPLADLTRLEVTPRDAKDRVVVERREGGRWQMTVPVDTAADPNLVETLVKNLKDLRASRDAGTLEENPARYGLDNPRARVAVFGPKAGAPLAVLEVGGPTLVPDQVYARAAGAKGVDVVDTRLLGATLKPPFAWRDRTLVRVPSFRVESIAIHQPGPNGDVEVRRDERRWRLTRPVATPADDDRAEGLAATLGALQVAEGPAGFVADDVRDLAPYGLDAPSMTVTVTPFQRQGSPQVFKLGKPVPDKPDHVYALRGDQDDVVAVDVKLLREAYGGPSDLRSKRVTDFAPGRTYRLRIDSKGQTFDLVRDPDRNRWGLTRPEKVEAGTASVQTLLSRLAELQTSEFLDPARVPNPSLEPPAFRVRLWQAGPGESLPTGAGSDSDPDAAPQLDLRLGRHDALRKTVFAQLAGDSKVLALPDAVLEVMPRNEFAYRDLTVLTLDPAQVETLTVERQGTRSTVRAPGSGVMSTAWRMVEPVDAPADVSVITNAIVTLSDLRAASWESARVGDGKAFGLDAPPLRVQWTTRKTSTSPVTTTLRVGKVKPNTPNAYANVEGRPEVFTLPPATLAAIQVELHDHSVFTFPTADVRRVLLEWPGRTLALRQQPARAGTPPTWQPEAGYDPTGFDLGRFAGLLGQLAALETNRFLQYAGPIPRSHGLDPPRVKVSVWTAGAKEPRVLRVGTATSPTESAATSVTGDDGPVFLIGTPEAWNALVRGPTRADELPADPFAAAPTGR